MILYIETLKVPPKTSITNKLSKVEEYKINMQKSVAFLYTDCEERNFI